MFKLKKTLPLLAGAALLASCATQTRTVTTETTYAPASTSATAQTTSRTTTETQTEPQQESGGLLSGTVDVIGKTIALPFRVVGGLVDVIF
jgi:uncharacterized lipoprotein YajG